MEGWCPFAVRRETANFGYPQGVRGQNRPFIIVSHIMDGYKRTLDDPAWRETNGVGVHFGIGRDGSISQYTNVFDASWGNGIVGSLERYDRSNRRLAALEQEGVWRAVPGGFALVRDGVNVLNSRSISIEHEGFPGDPWTPEMIEATVRVHAWCLREAMRSLGPPSPDMLVGHYQIDAVNRSNCPSNAWPRSRIWEEMMSYVELTNDILEIKKLLYEQALRMNAFERLLDAVLVPLVSGDRQRAEQVMKYLYALGGKQWPF